MLQKVPTSYYGYTWISQFDPHGTVHIWIGGTLDCKVRLQMARQPTIVTSNKGVAHEIGGGYSLSGG